MPSKVTIAKLVKSSIARNTPKRIVTSLLSQTLDNNTISDNELLEGLIELNVNDFTCDSLVNEQAEIALDYASLSVDNINTFFRLLPKLSVKTQCKYLTYLKKSFHVLFKGSTLQEFLGSLLPKYTLETEELILSSSVPSHTIKALWSRLMFLWRAIVQNHPHSLAGFAEKIDGAGLIKCSQEVGFSTDYVNKLLLFIPTLTKNGGTHLDHDLSSGLAKTPLSAASSYSLNTHAKKYACYLKMKKVNWLNARFKTWNFNEQLLEQYVSYFKVGTQSPTGLVVELVDIFFAGLLFAIELNEEPYVIFNWKNYIVSRFSDRLINFRPLQIAGITDDIGEALISTTMLYDMAGITRTRIGGAPAPYDLRKKFLRSCMYLQIISLDQFGKAFSEEARSMSQSLITHEVGQLNHVDQITHEFNSKLARLNIEFTSFEESKLIEYFHSLPNSSFEFSEVKQNRLSSLVQELVLTSIKEKNNEKLGRLLLSFLNCLQTTNFVFFCSNTGPWLVLEHLIKYIDDECFAVDDDDCNFQDVYASFGITLSSIISIVCFFGIDIEEVNIKLSYTVDYINKFFFRLADCLTNSVMDNDEEDKTIISNYDTLLADWIASLFDVNNEGLSDELLKSINVKQIYKFMLIIFQKAVSARIINVINSASISNGIDYLSQNFLAPCSIEILKWIATKIGGMQTHSDALIEIILKIIESNMGSNQASNINGPNFTFKMILNIVAPFIFRALDDSSAPSSSKTPASANVSKLLKFLQSTVDYEFCIPHKNKPLETETREGRFPLKSVKAELALLTKKSLGDIPPLVTSWAKIANSMRSATPVDLSIAILEEIGRCLKAPLHAQSEESRLMVDFLVSAIVTKSCITLEEINYQLINLDRKIEYQTAAVPVKFEFLLSMDNHYSSIFNEGVLLGSPAAPEIKSEFENKDDLMGFDTDDLFNDMPQDLFDDPMDLVPTNTTQEPPKFIMPRNKIVVSMLESYQSIVLMNSQLVTVVLFLNQFGESDSYWGKVCEITKGRIRLELNLCLREIRL